MKFPANETRKHTRSSRKSDKLSQALIGRCIQRDERGRGNPVGFRLRFRCYVR
jgi:hypothetical protein